MSKMSRRIVVDASIVGAATEKIHPTSEKCRLFLLDMYTVCHVAVLSEELSTEWRNHASDWSVRWMASMRAKRKIVTIETDFPGTPIVLSSAKFDAGQLAAMEKDLLLIEAAISTDRRIASLDSTVRRLFAEASEENSHLAAIIWVDPTRDEDNASSWLKSGARDKASVTLHSYLEQLIRAAESNLLRRRRSKDR
jgi:hypothetical protein